MSQIDFSVTSGRRCDADRIASSAISPFFPESHAMTVKQRTWRFASLLAVALIVGTATASQAGVIPWAYDAIFGPVRYPVSGYGSPVYTASYAPTYYASRSGYAPVNYGYVSSGRSSGCSSCSTSYYAPVNYAPSYGCGSCGPVAVAPSCGSCGVACGTPSSSCDSGCSVTPSNAKPTESNGTTNGFRPRKEPEANRSNPPKPQTETFVTPSNRSTTDVESPTNEGFGNSGRTRGLRTDDANEATTEALKPVPTETETVIPKAKKVPVPTDDLEGDQDDQPLGRPLELNKKTDGEAKIQLPLPKMNLDDKIAWRAEAPRTRIPFHAKAAKVSVARRVPSLNNDWTPVVAKANGPQLVKK